jgi:hypothetical protein
MSARDIARARATSHGSCCPNPRAVGRQIYGAFDVAVSVFGACGCAGTTTSLVDVAAAFDHLGDAAAALAKAIEAEDRRTGTAPADPRRSTVRLARLAAPVPSNRCPL